MDLLRKISADTIMCGMPAWPQTDKDRDEELYTIVGVADAIREGETQYGKWIAFCGNFVARRSKDKKEFASGETFIPEPLESMLLNSLKANGMVQIAVRVCAKYDKRSKTGYTYYVKPLKELPESDTMKQLRSLMDKPDEQKQIQ